MAAHQTPSSLGFSRQEHWCGLPYPSPMHKSKKWKWRCSVVSDSQQPHGLQPTRLLRPWDFLGKSTGVGCHCLLCEIILLYINTKLAHYFPLVFNSCYTFHSSLAAACKGKRQGESDNVDHTVPSGLLCPSSLQAAQFHNSAHLA